MGEDFPSEIGKYKVLRVIAKGGMGVVYKAIHPSLKRYVVIKKLTARKNGNAERFKREAQILLDLQSPYIVHLFDYFTDGGYRYMVEELVDGMAVDKLLEKQVILPPQIAMLIMQDACHALKFAHARDIVHRDIKPGNILLSKRGEIKLADFGIASDYRDEGSDEKEATKAGVALGTPAYMPPEQFEDSSAVDSRADIYALGIMLYEMVTGAKPYPSSFTLETLNTIKKGKYINPRKIDKTIPIEICFLIHKMIRPKASKRYQSVEPILRVVKKYLRHYDVHEIRVQLAKSVIVPKGYKYQGMVPKDKKQRLLKRGVIGGLAAIVFFATLIDSGFFQRTIFSHWFSSVKAEINMPVSLGFDFPIKAVFYGSDGTAIFGVKGGEREFKVKGGGFLEKLALHPQKEAVFSGGKGTVYDTKPVYLKNGDYRVKVVVGSCVRWKSFSVNGEDVSLGFDFLKNMHRPLKVQAVSFDKETGEEITSRTKFEVFLPSSGWIEISRVDKGVLQSGGVWKFRAISNGYKEEVFSLVIDWYQDDIFLSANLEKE